MNRMGDMRTIQTAVIAEQIKEMCIEANHFLSGDMKACLERAAAEEKAPLGKQS